MDNIHFDNIISLVNHIDKNIIDVENILNKLNKYYKDLIKENNSKIFLFGIDSLFFQNKLIETEFNNLNKLYTFILNRMYCEYYKLFKIVLSYLYSKFSDFEEVHEFKNNYPKYDVLDIYKYYDFKIIHQLHNQINKMVDLIKELLNSKFETLNDHKKKFFIGLNINNFVNTYHSEINKIENQIDLFKTYLKFFNDIYYKSLHRFYQKLDAFHIQVNNDLNFDYEDNNPKLNDTIVNNIHINHFKENENDGEEETNTIHEVLEMNEMFSNDININKKIEF